MPAEMTTPQLTVINGVIYVGGGNSDQRSLYQLCKYHPAYNQWSVLACPVKFFGLGQLGGTPVLVGGSTRDGTVVGEVFVLDESSQTLINSTDIPPMPTARKRSCIISCSFGIAVCGGRTGQECTAVVEVYKTATHQWHATIPLPRPLMMMRTTTIGSMGYLLGGHRPNEIPGNAKGDCYGISLNDLFHTTQHPVDWQTLPPAPLAAAPATLFGALVTVGGCVDVSGVDGEHLHAFSPITRSWIHIGLFPHEIVYCCAAVLERDIFVMGGRRYGFTRSKNVFIGTIE